MIGLAQDALQAPIYTALNGKPGMGGVYDHVPETATMPYTVIGEYTEVPDDILTSQGREVTVTLHSWSDALGSKEVRELGGVIVNLLDGAVLTVGTLGLVRPRFEFAQTLRETDEATNAVIRHLVQRFRFRLYER